LIFWDEGILFYSLKKKLIISLVKKLFRLLVMLLTLCVGEEQDLRNFDVWLTVHFSVILVNDQLYAQIIVL